jgi:Flp pilus assembly pilin Flp
MAEKLRQFWKKDDGAVAIEFAFHFFPVTICMIGVFETIWMMVIQNDMSRAAADVSRTIRVGGAYKAGSNPPEPWEYADLKNAYCARLWVITCDNASVFDVRELSNYGDAWDVDRDNPAFNTTTRTLSQDDVPALNFGGPSSVVLFRVYGAFPGLARLWNPGLAHLADGRTLIRVTELFVNEPYK